MPHDVMLYNDLRRCTLPNTFSDLLKAAHSAKYRKDIDCISGAMPADRRKAMLAACKWLASQTEDVHRQAMLSTQSCPGLLCEPSPVPSAAWVCCPQL